MNEATSSLSECFPRGVTDPLCPDEHVIETTTDHRILWYLEMEFSLSGSEELRCMARTLRRYLNETCQHHWHDREAEEDLPVFRQCLWCSDVEWQDDGEASDV